MLYRYASCSRLFFDRNNKKFEILFLVFVKFEIIINLNFEYKFEM